MGNVGRRRARCKFSLSYLAWRAANLESASPSEDEGLCRAKSRQRGYAVLAPLERAPRLRSGMRMIYFAQSALGVRRFRIRRAGISFGLALQRDLDHHARRAGQEQAAVAGARGTEDCATARRLRAKER